MEAVNYEILRIAENCDSPEESVQEIGKAARRYLDGFKEL